MGWALPDVSLEDLLKLIKGFVDILILASGYQSSGLYAHWDTHNIRKAFQWGFFFEAVCRRLKNVENFHDMVKELDASLSELTSNPFFPEGLSHLSFASLTRARELAFQHLIHAMPLRDAHLKALMNAVLEMDFDENCGIEGGCLNVYLGKLRLLNSPSNPLLGKESFVEASTPAYKGIEPHALVEGFSEFVFSKLMVQELLKRQFTVSSIFSVESGLDIILKMIRTSHQKGELSEEQANLSTETVRGEKLIDYATWSSWMSKNLSYLFDKRTVRLVSGAHMIFSAPKIQWIRVFQQMSLVEVRAEDSSESIELLLLGCVASRWSQIIKLCMALSFDSISISKLYCELCGILIGSSKSPHCKEDTVNSKENDILEYLVQSLGGHLHQLWKVSPILVSAAIPSWSPLFRIYLSEIDTQFKGEASSMRYCNCTLERKEHEECELAKRIWCLHAFHVGGFHSMPNASGGA